MYELGFDVIDWGSLSLTDGVADADGWWVLVDDGRDETRSLGSYDVVLYLLGFKLGCCVFVAIDGLVVINDG